MPRAKRAVGAPDVIEGRGDLVAVVGMLVRKHQLSRRRHRTRFVAVQPLYLLAPLPALVFEIEAERSHTLW